MKTVKFTCDFCGKELSWYITGHCNLSGTNNENHTYHAFKLDLCNWCYEKVNKWIKSVEKNDG